MTIGARLSSLKWVAFSVLAGLAVPGLLLLVARFPLLQTPVQLIILLALPLMVVPFLALRPHWLWWPASLAGPFVGLVGGFIVLHIVFGLTLFCFGMGARFCEQDMQRTGLWNALELVAPLAVMGLLQALTVRGIERKVGWFLTSLAAAFAFVYGLIGLALALGVTAERTTFLWPAAFLAGGLWGIIAGIGLAILKVPRSSRTAPLPVPSDRR